MSIAYLIVEVETGDVLQVQGDGMLRFPSNYEAGMETLVRVLASLDRAIGRS